MKELLQEYRRQKDIIDKKVQNLSDLPASYKRNKELLIASEIQFDLAVAIKELEKYVLE